MAQDTTDINIRLNVLAEKGQKSLRDMREEAKLLNIAMSDPNIGKEQFENLSARLGTLRNDMGDTARAMKMMDPGELLGGFAKMAQGAVGSFGMVTGAMSLFGDQSEEMVKIQQRAVAVIEILTSLESFRTLVIDGGARAEYAAMGTSIKRLAVSAAMKLGIVTETAAIAANTVATGVNTTAKGAEVVATEAATVSTLELNSALLANPAVAITAGIIALVAAVYLVTKAMDDSSEQTEANNKHTAEFNKTLQDSIDRNKELAAAVADAQDEYDLLMGTTTEVDIQLKKINASQQDLIENEAKAYTAQTTKLKAEFDKRYADASKAGEDTSLLVAQYSYEKEQLQSAHEKVINSIVKKSNLERAVVNKNAQNDQTKEDKIANDKRIADEKTANEKRIAEAKRVAKEIYDINKEIANKYDSLNTEQLKSDARFSADVLDIAEQIAVRKFSIWEDEQKQLIKGTENAELQAKLQTKFEIEKLQKQRELRETYTRKLLADENGVTQASIEEDKNRLNWNKKMREERYDYSEETTMSELQNQLDYAEKSYDIDKQLTERYLANLKVKAGQHADNVLKEMELLGKLPEKTEEVNALRLRLTDAYIKENRVKATSSYDAIYEAQANLSERVVEDAENTHDTKLGLLQNDLDANVKKQGILMNFNKKYTDDYIKQLNEIKDATNTIIDAELNKRKESIDKKKELDQADLEQRLRTNGLGYKFEKEQQDAIFQGWQGDTEEQMKAIKLYWSERGKISQGAVEEEEKLTEDANAAKVENEKQTADEIIAINEYLAENKKEMISAGFDMAMEAADAMMEISRQQADYEIEQRNRVQEIENARIEKEINDSYDAAKIKVENSVMSEKEKNAALYDIEKKKQKEEEKLEAKKYAQDLRNRQRDFKAKQSQALTSIAIDTVLAIAKTFATMGWPAGIIPAALAAVAGVAQAAVVSSQKPPQFARGGLISGQTHAAGGTVIEAENGEVILNAKSMANPTLRSYASAINVAGGGIAIPGAAPVVPVEPTQSISVISDGSIRAIVDEVVSRVTAIPVVLSEQDVTKTQRRVSTYERNSTIG